MKGINWLQYITKNFSAKVFTYVLLSMIIIFGAMNIVSIRMQETILEKNIIESGLLMTEILSRSTRLGVFSENRDQIISAIEGVVLRKSVVGACVMTMEGKCLYDYTGDKNPSNNDCFVGPDENRRDILQRIIKLGPSPIYFEKENVIEFWGGVTSAGPFQSEDYLFFEEDGNKPSKMQLIGAIGIVVDKAVLNQGISDLKKKNLYIGFLFLVVAGIITYLIVRDVSAPLIRLIQQVKQRDPDTTSKDDVGVLSDTFSGMIQSLEESFRTINDLKNNLEIKVEERTKELKKHSQYLEETNVRLEETLNQLKETQSQLVHSEKMAALGQLVAGVAHEINNTTNFISGALPPLTRIVNDTKKLINRFDEIMSERAEKEIEELLAEMEVFREEYRIDRMPKSLDTILANISEGAKRTSKIVQDLKTFSRPELDMPGQSDIHENIDSTLTLLFNEYKYNVEIIKEYGTNIPKIKCFPSQLNQVFLNILLNSIQAIPDKGHIIIKTWKTGQKIHIVFKDNGKGMSEEVRTKMFDPFFTTKEVGQGTGLGLSISYGIIKKHKGKIIVRSEEGIGTELELVLNINPNIVDSKTAETTISEQLSQAPSS